MTIPEIPDMPGSDIPETAGRKTTTRRTQAIAKRYEFHANAKIFKGYSSLKNVLFETIKI